MDEIDEAEKDTHEKMKEVFTDYSDAITTQRKNHEELKKLFAGLKFFISREVPRESLEFVIRCFGGAVSYEGPQGTYLESDESITHQITDRTVLNKSFTRDYVQPQWVFDSVNNQILMPTFEYAVNAKLPPHLSPFVNDELVGYVPERRQKIDEMINLARGIIPKKEKKKGHEKEQVIEDDSEDELEAAKLLENRYAKGYTREAKGERYSSEARDEDEKATETFVKKRIQKKKQTERQIHNFRRIIIPTHRLRNAYITHNFSRKRKLGRVKEILTKRAKIDKEKSDVEMSTY
jgi:pescadillo protein